MVPDAVYRVSGEFYAQKQGECDGSAAVKWCSPSVVICPGKYTGDYYNTGGCNVGLAPSGANAWETFKATFTARVSRYTVYINQQSTSFSSIVNNLTVVLIQEGPSIVAPATVITPRLVLFCMCVASQPGIPVGLALRQPKAGKARKCFPPLRNVTFAGFGETPSTSARMLRIIADINGATCVRCCIERLVCAYHRIRGCLHRLRFDS